MIVILIMLQENMKRKKRHVMRYRTVLFILFIKSINLYAITTIAIKRS